MPAMAVDTAEMAAHVTSWRIIVLSLVGKCLRVACNPPMADITGVPVSTLPQR